MWLFFILVLKKFSPEVSQKPDSAIAELLPNYCRTAGFVYILAKDLE